MKQSYALKVSRDDDGNWHVSVPAMPGIMATGKSEVEMQDNLIDAIKASGYLDHKD